MVAIPAERLAILKKNYVALCCAPRVQAIKSASGQISDYDARIANYQRALITQIREKEFKILELEMLKKPVDMHSKEIEFDKLLTHPDIENIAVDGSNILVYTVPIEIEHRHKVYDIGKFCITLSSNANNNWIVLFKNLTRTEGDGRPHPHVNSDGRPCLGNINECLPSIIGAHQYAAAISVAIQYIRSYTNNDEGKPYVDIEYWPVKKRVPVSEKIDADRL